MMTTSAVLSMAASRCSVQVYSIGCGRGASRDAGLRATLMPITAMRPFLIGIAGPSCSGKTDFAKALALSLPGAAVIVPLASYYRRLDRGAGLSVRSAHPRRAGANDSSRPLHAFRGLVHAAQRARAESARAEDLHLDAG